MSKPGRSGRALEDSPSGPALPTCARRVAGGQAERVFTPTRGSFPTWGWFTAAGFSSHDGGFLLHPPTVPLFGGVYPDPARSTVALRRLRLRLDEVGYWDVQLDVCGLRCLTYDVLVVLAVVLSGCMSLKPISPPLRW